MKYLNRILSLLLCLTLITVIVPSYANAATNNYDKYNFTWEVSAIGTFHHRSNYFQDGDEYYFDFDHGIVVYVHYQYSSTVSNSKSSHDFKAYKLIQNSNGIMDIVDFSGNEQEEHFKMEGLLLKKILVCDSNGNIKKHKTITVTPTHDDTAPWNSRKIKEQPPSSVKESGFYKTYPNPANLLAKFKN